MNNSNSIEVLEENEFKLKDENNKIIYVSDALADKIDLWINKNEAVIIDAGMSRGKTQFILTTLFDKALKEHKKILFLVNRHELKESIKNELKKRYGEDLYELVMEVNSYQNIQKYIKQNKFTDNYDYIVCDEIHYLANDLFNKNTIYCYNMLVDRIKNKLGLTIMMSATAEFIWNLFMKQQKLISINNYYKFYADYSHIKSFHIFERNTDIIAIDKMIQADLELEEKKRRKAIIFCETIKEVLELKNYFDTKYNNKIKVAICFSNSQQSLDKRQKVLLREYRKVSKELLDFKNNTFNATILLTTKVLDNGVEFKDEKIQIVSTRIFDIVSATQSVGRVRAYNGNKIDIYVKNYGNDKIKRTISDIEERIDILEECIDDINCISKYCTKRKYATDFYIDTNRVMQINMLAYYKYKYDLDVYKRIIKRNKAPFKTVTENEAESIIDVAWSVIGTSYASQLDEEAIKIQNTLEFLKDKEVKIINRKAVELIYIAVDKIFKSHKTEIADEILKEANASNKYTVLNVAQKVMRNYVGNKLNCVLDEQLEEFTPPVAETIEAEAVEIGLGYSLEIMSILEVDKNFPQPIIHKADSLETLKGDLYTFLDLNSNDSTRHFKKLELFGILDEIIKRHKEFYNYFISSKLEVFYSKLKQNTNKIMRTKKKLENETSDFKKDKLEQDILYLEQQQEEIKESIDKINNRSNMPHSAKEWNDFFRLLDTVTGDFPFLICKTKNRTVRYFISKRDNSRMDSNKLYTIVFDIISETQEEQLKDEYIIKQLERKGYTAEDYYNLFHSESGKVSDKVEELIEYLELCKISGTVGADATYRKVFSNMKQYEEYKLEEYLDSICNKKLYEIDRKELCERCNFKDSHYRLVKGIDLMQVELKKLGYSIVKKRIGKKKVTVWIINKIQQEE